MMNPIDNRKDVKQRRLWPALRRAGNAWLEAFARHTPTGPNSLATGQAGAVRYGQPCNCTAGSGSGYPSHAEFGALSRQVFWI